MRIANVEGRLVVSTAAGYVDVASASGGRFSHDPQAAFEVWDELVDWSHALPEHEVPGAHRVTEDAVLGPPVPRPRQVFAIGLNYRDHAEEVGLAVPETPAVFTKFPTSLTGPAASVRLPAGSVDWGVALVVAIGRRCERVGEAEAWHHVAGVTVGQDLSERGLQLAGSAPQFSLGKSYPGFAPTGPALVTPDELADPDDLELGCGLAGGEVLQRGRTGDMVFGVPELIARLSAVCPLLPGDLIFTGTPAGVGVARTPPVFLTAGDTLVSWITGVGQLRNPMVDGSAARRGSAGQP
ncbi:2-keto-4-pentenoate hydratase/2-oxohepta-3-ene-1,7-dioic acid hydratase in catechol pathway [Saccharothrix coeruleofusca]|uniref:fumarylacetoacetate hydrolase family protein n=1 Tax=Saccharothrix coeruleofusca TaxID=33919 RepID=UPI001AE6C082|nr:fumarylacetoacetate hydrolase family protein [Saccharothrix coeruleofusca]MBP2336491.1 2-keto-4-pentenoate hydratase/2-oxohepta-3-ene-1,7-dioic acid hydratase in catechol pathway [Saccharothrix coeruleofusca]